MPEYQFKVVRAKDLESQLDALGRGGFRLEGYPGDGTMLFWREVTPEVRQSIEEAARAEVLAAERRRLETETADRESQLTRLTDQLAWKRDTMRRCQASLDKGKISEITAAQHRRTVERARGQTEQLLEAIRYLKPDWQDSTTEVPRA